MGWKEVSYLQGQGPVFVEQERSALDGAEAGLPGPVDRSLGEERRMLLQL